MHDGIGRRGLFGAAGAYLLGSTRASATPLQQASNGRPGSLTNVSPTVRSFIFRLGFCQDYDPRPWYDALVDDLDCQDLPESCPSVERRQAEFFAQLAVTRIVPFYLRYAGLPALAAGVQFPVDLVSAGRATHDLIDAFVPVELQEFEGFGWHPAVPLRHRAAYCAALHAGNACLAATRDDRYEWVTSVKMVGIRVSFAVAMNHAAMVAIWVGAASMVGAMSSAIGSVCM